MKAKKYLTFIGLTLCISNSWAQFSKVTIAGCAPPTATASIDINNVRAQLMNGGDMWWDIFSSGNARYEIPKGSFNHSLFCGSIWMSGIDNDGFLHTAGQAYRQRGIDFWPGPLNQAGVTDAQTCSEWDKMFSVTKAEIDAAKNGTNISSNILAWPGTHAPYKDFDFNGLYEPNKGDYPLYDPLVPNNIPDQMIWWVINDAGNTHTAYPGGVPLNAEIQITAFAYATNESEIVNNSTIYRYRIINKGSVPLYDFKVGNFIDPDLGDANDDYIGCNFTSNGNQVFFCYNGDSFDDQYGSNPPAVGITYLKRPKNENGIELTPSSFMFFTNQSIPGINGDPNNSIELFRYLNARWADNQYLSYGSSNGRGTGDSTMFAFPGNVYNPSSWIETDIPSDRRMVPAVGYFTLAPGGITELVMAAVWARTDSGQNRGSVAKLLKSSDTLHTIFRNNFSSYSVGFNQSHTKSIKVYPNPFAEKLHVDIPNKTNEIILLKLYDLRGRKVLEKEYDPISTIKINTSDLEKGVYVLEVIQGNQKHTKKIIK